MNEVEPLILPNGQSVDSHTMSIHDEAMRDSMDAVMVEGATHVVTIRGGRALKAGEWIGLRDTSYEALAVYDPYDRPGVDLPAIPDFAEIREQNARQAARDAAEQRNEALTKMLRAQKGKWTKILVRMT